MSNENVRLLGLMHSIKCKILILFEEYQYREVRNKNSILMNCHDLCPYTVMLEDMTVNRGRNNKNSFDWDKICLEVCPICIIFT
jgi:hypothetical protein